MSAHDSLAGRADAGHCVLVMGVVRTRVWRSWNLNTTCVLCVPPCSAAAIIHSQPLYTCSMCRHTQVDQVRQYGSVVEVVC